MLSVHCRLENNLIKRSIANFFCRARERENLEGYALLYISDNKRHDIISGPKEVQEARRKELRAITYAATEILK